MLAPCPGCPSPGYIFRTSARSPYARSSLDHPSAHRTSSWGNATTLARLEPLLCKLIDAKSSSEPDYWEYIWDHFAVQLTVLVTLHVDEHHHRDRLGRINTESRYVIPIPEVMAYLEVYDVLPSDAAPAAAFRRFQLTVAARSEEARGAS
ncbi:hypothetical protein EDB87DRAFT_1619796 [Lactarius vividus]|nr:hypothetical protein EDB87DRAFT_1619796 [Lactarius vividus]